MSPTLRILLEIFCSILLFLAAPARAAALDARFAGDWRIDSAAQAPWAKADEIDPKEAKGLIGKRVSFGATAVSAPHPLGCNAPNYTIREGDGPETLFEGMLGAADTDGKPRDAATLARAIGMATPTVATLETGCSEIAVHALAPDRLVFALDNQIYTLKRARK